MKLISTGGKRILSLRAKAKLRRRLRYWIPATVVALGIGLLALTGPGQSLLASANAKPLPIYCVDTGGEKKACLTFDAAWGNEDTQQLIDILGNYGVKATFFVVGEWVDKYPESVKALFDAGHEIMNHSADHAHFTQLSPDQIVADLTACNKKIAQVTGVTPTLFRPPYGDYNDSVVATVRDCGMYTIQWDVDSLDWKDPAPADITSRVLKRVQPGSIILFHNAAKNTPSALPSVIEGLIQQGYTMVPVSQLILRDNYSMDHTGRQIPGTAS
jgi:polysaccharide deacetylase family sporulation protein PdaB